MEGKNIFNAALSRIYLVVHGGYIHVPVVSFLLSVWPDWWLGRCLRDEQSDGGTGQDGCINSYVSRRRRKQNGKSPLRIPK